MLKILANVAGTRDLGFVGMAIHRSIVTWGVRNRDRAVQSYMVVQPYRDYLGHRGA